METINKTHIKWATRVSPDKIRQLYADDARQIINHDLLQDVGIAFYARAEAIIEINRIHMQNIATCPACKTDIRLRENSYSCNCGWCITQKDLHHTYKGKQAVGPSIVEFAEKFIRDWNRAAGDARKQMIAIDFLIHRFHWEMTERPTRPVAVNYIDGSMGKVTALILELAESDDISRVKNREEWVKNQSLARQIWGE